MAEKRFFAVADMALNAALALKNLQGYLNGAMPPSLYPVLNDFTPPENGEDYDDLVHDEELFPYIQGVATIVGSDTFAMDSASDAANGDTVLYLKPPIGGWEWESGISEVTPYPVTVYGFAVTRSAGSQEVIGSLKLNEPVTITAPGQLLSVEAVWFSLPRHPFRYGSF